VTRSNVVERSAAVTERGGGFLNHERHETHEKESLMAVAGASNVFSTTEQTEHTETWALVGRVLQTAAYKSGSLGFSPGTYFWSSLNSRVLLRYGAEQECSGYLLSSASVSSFRIGLWERTIRTWWKIRTGFRHCHRRRLPAGPVSAGSKGRGCTAGLYGRHRVCGDRR